MAYTVLFLIKTYFFDGLLKPGSCAKHKSKQKLHIEMYWEHKLCNMKGFVPSKQRLFACCRQKNRKMLIM